MLTFRTARPEGLYLLLAATLAAGACAARQPQASAPLPVAIAERALAAPPVVVAAPPEVDPVAERLALSTRHVEQGERDLAAGHLEAARAAFDRALEVLMTAPNGARSEPRTREHFDRLVEHISAQEILALAQGDGFSEQRSEPAVHDALLDASLTEPTPTAETREAVQADLTSTVYDVDIPFNARVLAFVEMYSGRMKAFLEEGLSRGAKYLPMVQEVFRAEGIPLDLAYVPLVESAFKPSALSRARARGIWQFMPGTGLEQGLQRDWYIDERADPEKATRAAARYLRQLYKQFGDWHLALASYNGGPGRVQRAMQRSRTTDFWRMSASSRFLPRETRDYVPLILAAVVVARNPDQYGLTITPAELPPSEILPVSKPVDIRLVAEWARTPAETIQDLNPELRRWTTPLRASEYPLRVPAGTADDVRVRIEASTPEELAPLNLHTVKKGETLVSIARKLNVRRADLAEANYLSVRARLTAGQQLVVPRPPALVLAVRGPGEAPAGTSAEGPAAAPAKPDVVLAASVEEEPAAPPARPVVRASRQADTQPETTRRIHRVRRGDTLTSIAKLYRTSVASLKEWNRLPGNRILVGQRLTILSGRAVATD